MDQQHTFSWKSALGDVTLDVNSALWVQSEIQLAFSRKPHVRIVKVMINMLQAAKIKAINVDLDPTGNVGLLEFGMTE